VVSPYFCAVRRILFSFLFLSLMVGVFTSCSTTKSISKSNVSHLYRMSDHRLNPKYAISHHSADSSELHFQYSNASLLYTRLKATGQLVSKNVLRFYVYSSFDNGIVLDSARFLLFDTVAEPSARILHGSTKLKTDAPQKYVIRVVLEDMNRGKLDEHFISLDKTNHRGAAFFEAKDVNTGLMVYNNRIIIGQEVKVKYAFQVAKVYIRYYNRDFGLAPPPFATYKPNPFDFTPDSLMVLPLNNKGEFVFTPWDKGMYHISTDTSDYIGYTLVAHEKAYPKVFSAEGMAAPLRYLTSNREFNAINDTAIIREKVEEFWLERAGDKEKTRKLIESFYGRVAYANEFFSCHLEGWQSDRGMVYLIFGPPEVIFKSNTSETWTYGEDSKSNSLTFTFSRVVNPFSNNDFRLTRSPSYKTYWYSAVEAWRMGRTYSY